MSDLRTALEDYLVVRRSLGYQLVAMPKERRRGDGSLITAERIDRSRSTIWQEIKTNAGAGATARSRRSCGPQKPPAAHWTADRPWLW